MRDGLSRDLGFQTNAAMRARCRELAQRPSMDDYDRVVLMLLDDFARAMVLIAALSDAGRARSRSNSDLINRLREGVKRCGETDGGTELYDIDDAETVMSEAAASLEEQR